ncbi:hypothetical protein FLM55_02540 [Francisella sp. Scap27]|uniref:hypothetical protein n=1 Tax=Francisella sp. Scap27 TaxID=2589986 RepID=UPI0015B88328|nr:hypothetical protein [Francisella sp. Scap27]QLE78680.1 hypothetical protein FLM55_02540 [Francisella sp. Scap27]
MITLNDVMLECFGNLMFFIFAILLYKQNRLAWSFAILNILIITYLSAKYSISTALIFMSAQIVAVLIVGISWFIKPMFEAVDKIRLIFAIIVSLLILVIWVLLMYFFVNPYILNLKMLFGFDYLIYMLFVLGCIFVAFRLSIGLIILATVFISKSFYYSQTIADISSAPAHIKEFTPYFLVSACCMILAGVFLVVAYTRAKKNLI